MLAGLFSISSHADTGAARSDTRNIKSQLTIYVDAPVAQTGGTVLVVAKPVSKQEWDKLPAVPAQRLASGNAADITPGSKLFETVIASKVSIVEFVYPEGGSFGFNLVAANRSAPALSTKRILVGSGYYTDRKTGERVDWKDVSAIHIQGPEVDEQFSRRVRVSSGEIMNTYPPVTRQPGVTVHAPTDAQLDASLVKEPG
ncbi:hypothetical protein FXN63_13695 [Pigmentiphaga aceris]|uniref:Uncharacterized protein n=1 Tax=Pigmentiphaga aceris TaxID=1940612 RepID=A0A5C0B2E4_9BURK|nr:hypothetical protein [Pigmentiphaga aceris]QEI06767.1 hypothetical protein FXN63_13695 [Pigmentiphaga aceris]